MEITASAPWQAPARAQQQIRQRVRKRMQPVGTPHRLPAGNRIRDAPFMSLILEAAKGVKKDVLKQNSTWERIRRGAVLSAVLVKEASGLFLAVPYGFHALVVYGSLPRVKVEGDVLVAETDGRHSSIDGAFKLISHFVSAAIHHLLALLHLLLGDTAKSLSQLLRPKVDGIRVAADIQYGPAERNVLDVYIPEVGNHPTKGQQLTPLGEEQRKQAGEPDVARESGSLSSASASQGCPVLLFVHGGVWASGEKWQYAPMAVKCAQEGVVVVTIQYTLYPEALSCRQSQEVSQALSWTLDNINKFGGDPNRVFLSGHSSGAHISALALWERACARLRLNASENLEAEGMDASRITGTILMTADSLTSDSSQSRNGWKETKQAQSVTRSPSGSLTRIPHAEEDTRQPYCFLGLSGVYDIAQHLAHETKRGVDVLSCMTPANGGEQEFAQRSPALLLATLSVLSSDQKRDQSSEAQQHWADLGPLLGEQSKAAAEVQEALRMSPVDLDSLAQSFVSDTDSLPPQLTRSESVKLQMEQKLASLFFGVPQREGETATLVRVLERSEAQMLQLFPWTILTCSPGDIVVPPDTSISYAAALKSLGMPCKILAYEGVGHQEFACWSLSWDKATMPSHVKDMLTVLTK